MKQEKFLIREDGTAQFICTGAFHTGQLNERKRLAAEIARSHGGPLPCIVTLEGVRAVEIAPAPDVSGLSLS